MRRLGGGQRPWQTPSYNSWRTLSDGQATWQTNSRPKQPSPSVISIFRRHLGRDLCRGDLFGDDVSAVVVLEFRCARGIVPSRCCDGNIGKGTQRAYRLASESKRLQLVQAVESRELRGVMFLSCTSAHAASRAVPMPSKSSEDMPEPSSVTSRRSTP